MGCFLGCFGSSGDRKKRKQIYKAIRRDQNPKSQNLVQHDVSLVQNIKDNPSNSLPELRYGNCPESDDEVIDSDDEDEIDDGLDDDDDEEDFDNEEVWCESVSIPIPSSESRVESSLNPVLKPVENLAQWKALKSEGTITQSRSPQKENSSLVWCESVSIPIPSSESRVESSLNPVLKPVENLAQWKALKSEGTITQSRSPQKENSSLNSIPFPPKNRNQQTAVDASLSNWLGSSEKNTTNNKPVGCYNPDLEPVSSGKGFSQESTTTTVKSIEERPILGALTVDELKQFSGSSCTPRKSPGRSPDDMPIIGSVGSYWSHTGSAHSLSSTSSYKGIPNTTSKYREDKKVNWHNTPFETRLERALNRNAAE
ncbi:hypothetical protein L1987_63887 [Smallanthus sonchifolius]|uniref:Uncharacterized protein n=1 Tax=Smallanthus sonchifolius TaxID=185202 RepID=A0ACB9CET0_9ASTR|nr:hypothetical protein L1987_63887 [Smallanthus sonchifolius]